MAAVRKHDKKLKLSSRDPARSKEDDKPYEVLLIRAVLDEAIRAENEFQLKLDSTLNAANSTLAHLRRSLIVPGEVLVEIPAETFVINKDLAGGVYFKKRNEFLARFKASGKSLKSKNDIDSSAGYVKLVACVPERIFPVRKLAPGVCNNKTSPGTSQPLPTPNYNSRILEDSMRMKHENLVMQATKKCPELLDCFRLLRTWFLHHQPEDLVGGFPIKAVLLYLAELIMSPRDGSIWTKASASQLFKRAIRWIAEHDLVGESGPRQVGRIGEESPILNGFADSDFHHSFPVTVLDSSGVLNLAHSTLASSYRLLRRQALATMEERDEEAVFTLKAPSWERFDRLIRVSLPPAPTKAADHVSADEEANALFDDSWTAFACRKLDTLVCRALWETKRVKNYGLCKLTDSSVVLGLCIDPEKAFRLVDRGPAAEDAVAAGHFRAFWGDKAELRRFKDGSIVESVVWEERRKRLIPEMIVDHLLRIHTPFRALTEAEEDQITVVTTAISQALEGAADDTDENSAREALKLFTRIEKRIRGAQGLPLNVTDVVLARAPALRYTASLPEKHYMAFGTRDVKGRKEALALMKRQTSRCVPLVGHILVRFEGTSRWPDDPDARRKLECALLSEVARNIEQPAKAGGGANDEDDRDEALFADCFVCTENFIDILAGGFAFRLSSMNSYNAGGDSAAKLQTLLHSLHHRSDFGASRSFGQVSRLAKQWVSGQRFSSVISDDFVDLLVASLFTSSYPMDPPRGALCGLLRFFCLLSRFDFNQRPLIVDLVDYRSPSEEVKAEADKRFFQQKNSGAALPITIYVKTQSMPKASNTNSITVSTGDAALAGLVTEPWGDENTHLTEHSLGMLVRRAKASMMFLEMLCEKEATGSEATTRRMWQAVFNSDPYADFDAVLVLGDVAELLGSTQQREMTQFQNLLVSASRQALVGFDMVDRLVRELRSRFSYHAEFFVGSTKVPSSTVSPTTSIGVVWKRSLSDTFPFKISTARYAKPSAGAEAKVEFNREELLDEMCRLGRGFIVDVVVTPSDLNQ